ncbi:hemerythrin family protein [Telmatospirillum sp.]|uniref:bacteriohemerythrin n=1 Tax=Telmatospirillum sp. TaxID=2079197 RepID=UPI0028462126|nr:hemerythrin family protein [Telmatospirillum sp.]MDR3439445.1 hemerythrin family protein [Telmatospirillum sp.]
MITTPFIAWSSEMTVGVPFLDDEHRELIKLINELDAISANANRAEVESGLACLATYAVKHFHDEESFMTRIHFSRIALHQQQHDEFMTKVQSFLARLKGEDHTKLVLEILDFLADWWLDHILEEDKAYALEADI